MKAIYKTKLLIKLLPKLLALGLVALAYGAKGQTFVSQPMTTTPAAGAYYNNTAIVLSPGFSFTAASGQSLQLYIAPNCLPLAINPTLTNNYIITSVPRISGFTTTTTLLNQPTCNLMQTIEYFDGIDRPLQTVQVRGSPGFNDVVVPFAYDAYDREATKYLPYTSAVNDGSYKADALNAGAGQSQFYAGPPTGVAVIPSPYAQTGFEPSPLDRTVEQGAPGNPWQLSTSGVNGSGNTVKITYTNNDQSTLNTTPGATNSGARQAALYTVTINSDESRTLARLNNNATYGTSQLDVTIATDENWTAASGCLNTSETYKDDYGRTVLKRTYNLANGLLQMLSTYYVYDDKGNLCFVLPPGANPDATAAISQATLDNLCYQYRYDGRNRLSQKKLPGKGWEFMIYNSIDQQVLSQDANQRNQTPQLLTFSKYDGVGRTVMTGQAPVPGNPAADNNMSAPNQTYRQSLEGSYASAATNLWETTSSATTTGYTNAANPVIANNAYFTINYYDGYTAPGIPAAYTAPSGASKMTQGLLTAGLTTVLNTITNTTPDMLWEVHYYDNLGRGIQSYSQHYLGGVLNTANYDMVSNTYNFNNLPVSTTRKHYNVAGGATPVVTLYDSLTYDQVNREKQSWQRINTGPLVMLSHMDYNEIGQLTAKHLHSTDGTNFMQSITYAYNERGWLLSSSAPLFQEQLQYNNNTLALSSFTPQFNGNIGSQTRTAGATTTSYTYTYDNLNRLMTGISTDNYNEAGISYDQLGNIVTLQRTYGATTPIDNLTYTYTNSAGSYTNQVQSINDIAPDASGYGYKPGTYTYQYDMNGNMVTDASKGLSMTYNILNLPQVVTIPAGTDTYYYDASGRKLRKVSTAGTGATTDYIDGIEYDTGVLTFIQTTEGRALYNGGSPNYEYNLTDHLGDVRLSFDTHLITPTVDQQDDYMPFGYEISRSLITSPKNEYLYNKKELQEDLQLYDYGHRYYDPVRVQWTTIDPYAEKSRRLSPYNYVADNPIKSIDSQGDTIIVTQAPDRVGQPDEYGHNTITITVIGKVVNESSTSFTDQEMSNFVSRLNGAITNDYTVNDEDATSEVSSNLTVASANNPVRANDLVVRIVDPDKMPKDNKGGYYEAGKVAGSTPYGGNVIYISSEIVNSTPATSGPNATAGLSDISENTLERTGAHEFGHSANLNHPKPPGSMPGNLMNTSDSPDAGTKIIGKQINQILQDYIHKKLNIGPQKL